MLSGLVTGLITAWVLNCFSIGYMLIDAIQPFIYTELTIGSFYLIMAIIGALGGFLEIIFSKK